jgi:2-phosphoglycerate kinase
MVRNGNYALRSGWQTNGVNDRDWHVLLVGGPSGCGKSTVCAGLMRRFGVGCAEVDDITAAVKAMSTPEQQPLLHHWEQYGASREWTAPEILDLTVRVAEAIAPAVRAVVDTHLDNGPPVIMEGDYLLPSLLRQSPLTRPEVRAVFLYEPDEEQLVANFADREPAEPEQWQRARVSRLFGEWICEQAATYGVPALPVRPWDTVLERVSAAAAQH